MYVPSVFGIDHDDNGNCKAVHEPYKHLSEKEFLKLGYPKPIVDHVEARARALRRYKNPGEE